MNIYVLTIFAVLWRQTELSTSSLTSSFPLLQGESKV